MKRCLFFDLAYTIISLISAARLFPKILAGPRPICSLKEHIGLYEKVKDVIWLHGASAGEVRLLSEVWKELQRRGVHFSPLVTVQTLAGKDMARKLFADSSVYFFPLDFSFFVKQALFRTRPHLIIIAETEIWPNFLTIASCMKIPTIIINARISDRTYKIYRSIKPLKQAFKSISMVCAQSRIHRERFIELGARRVELTGNMKFEITIEGESEIISYYKKLFNVEGQQVIVGGSTHHPEEELLLNVYCRLREHFPDLRLILAPRHIHRAAEIEELIRRYNLSFTRRSLIKEGQEIDRASIILIDTIGELRKIYSIASVVFIGGTLTDRGGQNPVEPAVWGKPIISGPNLSNFQDVAEILLNSQILFIVKDAEELFLKGKSLITDGGLSQQISLKAKEVIYKNRGAMARTVLAISEYLK